MSAYCTQADVELRVPSEQLPRPARLVSSVSASTDTLTLEGHGLATDAPVTFRAESGGSLPSPLVAGTAYYAIRLTDSTFQIAAAAGGSAIDLTTTGTNVLLIKRIPWETAITWGSAIVDDSTPAHVVPFTSPYPQIVIEVTAELAAEWLRAWAGSLSAQLADRITWAQARIDRWSKGTPIRGTNAPVNAAVVAYASGFSAADPAGWTPTGGTIP